MLMATVHRYEQLLLNAALSEMGDAAQCPRLGCGYPIFREPGAPTLGTRLPWALQTPGHGGLVPRRFGPAAVWSRALAVSKAPGR